MKLQVLTWTPSRLKKYEQCPAQVKYEDLLKLCPVCFKGKLSGGYDGKPINCDACDEEQPEREALDHGTVLDTALDAFLTGKPATQTLSTGKVTKANGKNLPEEIRHPKIIQLAKDLRKKCRTQVKITLDKAWNAVSEFTKGAWGRVKLDVLQIGDDVAEIIDWKSGGLDKTTGVVKVREEYADQMRSYSLAVLSAHPHVTVAKARLAFVEAGPKHDPFLPHPPVTRASLPAAKKEWERKVKGLLNDRIFAPRPGYYCGWCPFAKKRGGPCRF